MPCLATIHLRRTACTHKQMYKTKIESIHRSQTRVLNIFNFMLSVNQSETIQAKGACEPQANLDSCPRFAFAWQCRTRETKSPPTWPQLFHKHILKASLGVCRVLTSGNFRNACSFPCSTSALAV